MTLNHPLGCRFSIDDARIGRHVEVADRPAKPLDELYRATGLHLLVVLVLARFRWVGRPFRWLFRFVANPHAGTFWGQPNVQQIRAVFNKHGAYFLHGTQGSGKSMGSVMLALVLAADMLDSLPADQSVTVFVNLTVYQRRAALLLASLGYPASVVTRIKVQGYSLMSPNALTLMRQRHSIWVADEMGYYMEDDKKAVRGVMLKAIRMARRRKQFWICANQEILHSRYRPLFRARGECSMRFGLMTIAWRGAQDIVDSRKPTKPFARIRYGLDVRRVAAIYDSWEDLEDITDEELLAA